MNKARIQGVETELKVPFNERGVKPSPNYTYNDGRDVSNGGTSRSICRSTPRTVVRTETGAARRLVILRSGIIPGARADSATAKTPGGYGPDNAEAAANGRKYENVKTRAGSFFKRKGKDPNAFYYVTEDDVVTYGGGLPFITRTATAARFAVLSPNVM